MSDTEATLLIYRFAFISVLSREPKNFVAVSFVGEERKEADRFTLVVSGVGAIAAGGGRERRARAHTRLSPSP